MDNNKTPFKFLQKEFKKYLKTRRLQKQQKKASKDKKGGKKKTSSFETASKSSAEQVPKQRRIEDEEAEEFEVIAGATPAHCIGKRKSKLRWKKEDRADKKEEEACIDRTEEEKDKDFKHQKKSAGDPVAQLRQELHDTKMAFQKQMDKSHADREEIERLLRELKAPNKKSAVKKKAKDSNVSVEPNESPETRQVASRILQILKRNHLLETALSRDENLELCNFFTTAGRPSEEVLKLLDKGMTIALDKLCHSAHELDEPVGNQMRELLIRQDVAKTVLLEVMLTEQQFLPLNWGGGKAAQKEDKKSQHQTLSVSLAGKI